jgi:hypothetical protein
MTVSSSITTHSYVPAGAMLAESLAGLVFIDPSDLVVTDPDDIVQVLGTDYEITGNGRTGAGSIRTLRAYGAGIVMTITRVTPSIQQADINPNQPLPAEAIELELDRRALVEQENNRDLSALSARALQFPKGEVTTSLPSKAAVAGKFLAFDAEGNPVAATGFGADSGLRTDLAASTGASLVARIGAGIGAVARSVADIFLDRNSVMDFIPFTERVAIRLRNSSADHTAYIQAAIDHSLLVRRALYMPYGDYRTTGLTVDLTAAASICGFKLTGEGRTLTRIIKTDAGTAPVIDLSHSTEPTTSNVEFSDFAITGNAKASVGIRNTAAASITLSRLFILSCDVGIDAKGMIASEIEYCYIAGCNKGINFRANGSLSAYSNANSISYCRIADNSVFGVDHGQGSLLRIVECDIEQNGTPGNTATGGVIVRSTVDDEIGTSMIVIDGTWFEANKGRTIQFEAVTSTGLFCQISNCNILSSESGRAIFAAGGGNFLFTNVCAPSPSDNFNMTCGNLTLIGCYLNQLSGTATNTLAMSTIIGGTPVEGTFQRGIQIGGGNGVTLSWGGGAGAYKLNGNSSTGDLDLTQPGTGSGIMKSAVHFNLDGKELRVSGNKIIGARLSALPANATDLASAIALVNAMKAGLSGGGANHGLFL